MRPPILALFGLVLSACAPIDHHIQALPAELAVEPAWQPSTEILQGDGFTRQDVAIPCGDTHCAAWLYLPEGAVLAPVVVMGNGFCGERQMVMTEYAERFAQAGLAALTFDYRHWGDSGGLPRYVFVAEEQVDDYASAVAWARSSPLVRGEHLAIWGTSASGAHVMSAAARDPRIDAVVAQVPSIVEGGDHDHDMFPEGTLMALVRLSFMDKKRENRGEERIYVRAYGYGEELAFMPGFGPQVEELLGLAEGRWPNVIAPGILLDMDEYHPDKAAKQVTAPTLFVVAERDELVWNEGTRKLAEKMPDARYESLDAAHFDFYTGESFERSVAMEIAFLRERLGLDTP
jgi:dienelactone hydrolase